MNFPFYLNKTDGEMENCSEHNENQAYRDFACDFDNCLSIWIVDQNTGVLLLLGLLLEEDVTARPAWKETHLDLVCLGEIKNLAGQGGNEKSVVKSRLNTSGKQWRFCYLVVDCVYLNSAQ